MVERLSDRCDAIAASRAKRDAERSEKAAHKAIKRADKSRRDAEALGIHPKPYEGSGGENLETSENPEYPGPIGYPLTDRQRTEKSPPGYSHGEWRNI